MFQNVMSLLNKNCKTFKGRRKPNVYSTRENSRMKAFWNYYFPKSQGLLIVVDMNNHGSIDVLTRFLKDDRLKKHSVLV